MTELDDVPDLPDEDDAKIEEIARQHPSAGDAGATQGSEQDSGHDDEQAADGGPGAGEDYAGSGL